MTLPLLGGNTSKLTLGRGVLYVKGDVRLGGVTPSEDGWRDMGNLSSLTISQESETKEHLDFQSGIATIDISVQISSKTTLSFVAEEMLPHNLAAFFAGTLYSTDLGNSIANPLGFANAAALPSNFFAGFENWFVDTNTTDYLYDIWFDLYINSAGQIIRAYDFSTAQTITVYKQVTNRTTVGPGATLVENRDYFLNRKNGMIRFANVGTSVQRGDTILVTWAASADPDKSAVTGNDTQMQKIAILQNSGINVAAKFVGENPITGVSYELLLHKILLKPEGEFSGIGDDFSGLGFSGVLSSITNPPPGTSIYGGLTLRNKQTS